MGARVQIPKNELTEFDLPRVCVITGASDGVEFFDVRFQFIPRWAVVFYFFCGPIGYLVAMSLLRKTAAGKLPFVEAAYREWRRMAVAIPVAVLGLIVAGAVGFAVVGPTMSPDAIPVFLVAFVIVLLVAVVGIVVFLRRAGPVCVEIDETHVTLELPSDAAATAIAERLHASLDAEAPRAANGRDALDDQIDAELNA